MESLQPNSISNLLLWRNVSKDSIQFNWDIGQLQRTGKRWKDDEEITLTTNIWTIHGFMCEMVAPPMLFSGPRGPLIQQSADMSVRTSVCAKFLLQFFSFQRCFPSSPQNVPRSPQNVPKSPKNVPERPHITQEHPQLAPEHPRVFPNHPPSQNCHWSHAKRPKITPKCSR